MTEFQFILISILYFWGSSTALSFGIGYYTLYRPLVSGMIAGMILGDITTGLQTGAIVNLIYIDFVSTGGSFKGDQCLTAVISAVAAIIFRLSPVESAAIAYPFGFFGILIWKYRLSINSVFVKLYEKKYNKGLNPNIAIYNGLLPQLLLYLMSTVVIAFSIGTMIILNNFIYYESIKNIFFILGILLTFSSIINIIINLKKILFILIFLFFLLIVSFFNISSAYLFFILIVVLFILSYKDIIQDISGFTYKQEGLYINKKDLVYSWIIWMNFSHSCYSYDRLQGMAFAHSMKNIAKKLYKGNNKVSEVIHEYSDFFNTEPNMGTPIHGYIISLEEKKIISNENSDIGYIKKGMMGIAAGLGDSFTQVVLTPMFITLSILLSLDKNYYVALLPIILLGIIILLLSYTGWMKGYYEGKESLIKRINFVKKSKIKRYSSYIFSALLGACTGKFINLSQEIFLENLYIVLVIIILTIIYTIYLIGKHMRS